jgi:tyrosyl-tRNA synthetase
MMTKGVALQVDEIMLGSDFGNDDMRASMRAELTDRLTAATREGRPLRVYAGYDPSKPDLHVGHAITLRKLRLFQDFGHDVTFVIGTFTAQIGDTSDKTTSRPSLAEGVVTSAAESYEEQAFRILDRERTTVVRNAEWLSKLGLKDVIGLASEFSVQQFLERDAYRKRLAKGDSIGLHEFIYPLLQGYDALELRADVQLGATDQLFNILAGRRLQQSRGQAGCVVLTYPILVGTDGHDRMSKSAGNYIGIQEPPEVQFGKVMSISDETMRKWLPLVASWEPARVAQVIEDLDSGRLHPMRCKKDLAYDVVTTYHGTEAANAAQAHFERVVQQGAVPEERRVLPVAFPLTVLDAVVASGATASRSEARRLIEQGGVRLDQAQATDPYYVITEPALLRVGRRNYFQLTAAEGGARPADDVFPDVR